ncbi:MAG: zinc-binding alcohol dehydrogenase family protein [Anaerolineales bacterium]|nr:zinc-binding alcohol dehydrogenase family protein [Anaerolineales bacterium]
MKAFRLNQPGPIEEEPLRKAKLPRPEAGLGQLLVRVKACGICHTDLHTVEGEIVPPHYPITPGHQVVGVVEGVGEGVTEWSVGERVGIPWLHHACRQCSFCARGEENLCPQAAFTGFDVDGGYSEWMLADARYTLALPDALSERELAPLLCAGIIGYRSLRKAELRSGECLGLVGFGASAHLAIQVAVHWGCKVYVFTRSDGHRKLAHTLGAAWVGGAQDQAPEQLDRAILFAPVGELVPVILEKIRPGGTLAINAIHMSPIPELEYRLIYGERTLRSVANATYHDGIEFLELAAQIPIRVSTLDYALEDVNRALLDLKRSRIDGAGVLLP